MMKNITTVQSHNGIAQVSLDSSKSLILNLSTVDSANNDGLRLDADGILILMNTFLRCLPGLILTNEHSQAVTKKGLPLRSEELERWQSDRTCRQNMQQTRSWAVAFLLSITQTEDDENMKKILDLCSSRLSTHNVHYPVLIQHLRNARVQIQQHMSDSREPAQAPDEPMASIIDFKRSRTIQPAE